MGYPWIVHFKRMLELTEPQAMCHSPQTRIVSPNSNASSGIKVLADVEKEDIPAALSVGWKGPSQHSFTSGLIVRRRPALLSWNDVQFGYGYESLLTLTFQGDHCIKKKCRADFCKLLFYWIVSSGRNFLSNVLMPTSSSLKMGLQFVLVFDIYRESLNNGKYSGIAPAMPTFPGYVWRMQYFA